MLYQIYINKKNKKKTIHSKLQSCSEEKEGLCKTNDSETTQEVLWGQMSETSYVCACMETQRSTDLWLAF